MTIEMRKIGDMWVRPEAVEAVTSYSYDTDGNPVSSIIILGSGDQRVVSMSPDAVVRTLAEDPVYSWGSATPVRPQFEGTVPRD